ncbi:MAG TPA: ankyrin repeat domain-containing protein [Gammaproteobacteria bacterium]|nr:ankyrin repeat domain-containing protein [Gammaproteobacteria bacterium]
MNHVNNKGDSVLITAADSGKSRWVQMLLEKDADVNYSNELDNGDTALIAASVESDAEVMQLLLNGGADVNHTNHEGDSALICAARLSRLDKSDSPDKGILILLAYGADPRIVNKENKTAYKIVKSDIITAQLWRAENGERPPKQPFSPEFFRPSSSPKKEKPVEEIEPDKDKDQNKNNEDCTIC